MRADILERVFDWPLHVTNDATLGAPALFPLRRPLPRSDAIRGNISREQLLACVAEDLRHRVVDLEEATIVDPRHRDADDCPVDDPAKTRLGADPGSVQDDTFIDFGSVLGVIAVALAAVNVAGGFLVTLRMLEMFRKKGK